MANRGNAGPEGDPWLAVIARSLAYLCLHTGEMAKEDLAAKSKLLTSVGLPLRDAASMLESTEKSLRELRRRAKKKKGGSRAKKAKPSRKR